MPDKEETPRPVLGIRLRENCPVCGSADHELLISSEFNNGFAPPDEHSILSRLLEYYDIGEWKFELYRCRGCRLIYQRRILDEKMMQWLYDEGITMQSHRMADFSFKSLSHTCSIASSWIRMLRYLKKNPFDLNVYEYGCGTGRWCMMAQSFGCRVDCYDIAGTRNSEMESRGFDIVPLTHLKAESYDIINCEQVLEHVASPREIFAGLGKALQPGGLLTVNVPNCASLMKFLSHTDASRLFDNRKVLGMIHPLEHINAFTQEQLLRLAREAGLIRIKPPLKDVYLCENYWFGAKRIATNLLVPLRDRFFDNTVDLWFTKKYQEAVIDNDKNR